MDRLWHVLSRATYWAAIAGCALYFLAALIVTAEVIVRKLVPDLVQTVGWLLSSLAFDVTKQTSAIGDWVRQHLIFTGSDEIAGYLFAVGTSWCMAYVFMQRGHIRIDAVYANLSARTRAWLDLIALVALAAIALTLAERSFDLAWSSFAENNASATDLRIPLWWPQAPWFAGLALFLLTNVVAIVRVTMALTASDLAAVSATAGIATQDEEIKAELESLGLETVSQKG